MRSISVHSKKKDVISSFQDIGANHNKNSEENRYNIFNSDDFNEKQPKKADLLVQTVHGSDNNNQ